MIQQSQSMLVYLYQDYQLVEQPIDGAKITLGYEHS